MEKDITHNQDQMGGQKKDIQIYEAVSNFIKDKEGMHVYRRAEKICKAYFLLTQHIQNDDSIKLKLRTLALDMSSKTLDFVTSTNKTEDKAREIAMKAMALVSVSDIAVSSHMISNSNFTLVVGQVQTFVEEMELYWKTLSYNNQAIPTHLFEMDALDASYKNSRTSISGGLENNNSFDNIDVSFKREISYVGEEHSLKDSSTKKVALATSKPSSHGGHVISKSSHHNIAHSTGSQTVGAKNDRQTLILSTIKNKGESSIKDLTDVIKGCSEKTIQRELIALVGSGDLLKTGERRWSRYTIAR